MLGTMDCKMKTTLQVAKKSELFNSYTAKNEQLVLYCFAVHIAQCCSAFSHPIAG